MRNGAIRFLGNSCLDDRVSFELQTARWRFAINRALKPNLDYTQTLLNNVADAGVNTFGHAEHNVTGLKESDFVDFAHFNFRPSASSPVIHAGVPIPGITDAMGKFPDCGPFQFDNPASDWKSGASMTAPVFPD